MPDFWKQVEGGPERWQRDSKSLFNQEAPAGERIKAELRRLEKPPEEVVRAAKEIFQLRPVLQEIGYADFVDDLDSLPETASPDGF